MREIVFDTETTGLNPQTGDRIVELGCVELINHIPTGRHFHQYINPERDVPSDAFRVHGLSTEFLSDKPVFAKIAQDFLDFIGEAKLVAHNASFDMNFINHELSLLGFPPISQERVIDTLFLARKRHPFGPNSLDALCQRYGIDNSRRTKHGALLDSEILADVYLELMGGRQTDLGLATQTVQITRQTDETPLSQSMAQQRPEPLPDRLSDEILQRHATFMATIKQAIWSDYLQEKTDRS